MLLALSLTLPSVGSAMEGGTSAMDGGTQTHMMKKDDRTKQTVDPTCVRPLVTAREDAIIAAEGALHTALSAALQTRKAALDAAWMLSDAAARKQAVKDAWKAFNTAKKSAHQAYRKAVKDAWQAFKKGGKSCSGTGESAGAGESEGSDQE